MTARDSYHEGVRDSRTAELHGRSMIDFLLAQGEYVSQTARAFGTPGPTLIEWIQPYRVHGRRGPQSPWMPTALSTQGPRSHHQQWMANPRTNCGATPKNSISQERIKLLLQQRCSMKKPTSTIDRILHQLKLVRPRSRKYQQKRQMARYRKRLQPLPDWQVVVKGPKDITHLDPPVTQQIPP